MEVEWRELHVTIGQKQILAPCSGALRPGRLVALMGPSGCGKSTFLSCLRQDIPHGGEVRYDGARFSPELRQVVGFVEQDDVVLPQLTVRQSLLFIAELRFGVGSVEATSRVAEIIKSMNLGNIVDSVVGTHGAPARISGGERKRLCIGRELLSDPRLLLCDEPTSGLDSTTANQVIASMRRLCDDGQVSVLAAVHQPSTDIFSRFDDLLLLRGGDVVYWGPAAEAEPFFVSLGLPRRPQQSASEYLMDLLVLDVAEASSPESETKVIVGGVPTKVRDAALAFVKKESDTLPPLAAPLPGEGTSVSSFLQGKTSKYQYEAAFFRQLRVLERRHRQLLIGETFTMLALVQTTGLMLISSLLWVQLGWAESDVFPRWGICLWSCGTWMFFSVFGGLGAFPPIRQVLEKELRVGCYSLEAFYVARTVLLLPWELALPTLWSIGVFWITNVNPDFSVFVQYLLTVYLSYVVFQGFGLAISASGMPPARAATLAILVITYGFTWSAFFVSIDSVPDWIKWAIEPNVFAYAMDLVMHVVLTDNLEFRCTGIGASTVGDESRNQHGCESNGLGSFVLTGTRARERHGISRDPLLCVNVLVGALVFFRLLAYVLLRRDLWKAIEGAHEAGLAPETSSAKYEPSKSNPAEHESPASDTETV